MRKELLLKKKKAMLNQNAERILTEEELKCFSIQQLGMICDILKRSEEKKENNNPFYFLSACEVLQKSSGKIAFFEDSGLIREETEEEVLSGAACAIYKGYMKKKRSI